MSRALVVLFLVLISQALFGELAQGGYRTFEDMLYNNPTVEDSTFYLVPIQNSVLKRTKLYTLRYTNERGRDRAWVAASELWGYSDGTQRYYFTKSTCSPLQSWNQSYAWFYMLVARTSSGTNGLSYLERPMVYDKSTDKAFELTFDKLEQFLEQTPQLLEEYQSTKRRKRNLGYFMNRFIAQTTKSDEMVVPEKEIEEEYDEPVYF